METPRRVFRSSYQAGPDRYPLPLVPDLTARYEDCSCGFGMHAFGLVRNPVNPGKDHVINFALVGTTGRFEQSIKENRVYAEVTDLFKSCTEPLQYSR